MSVIDTASPIRADSAMPGPKARKNSSLPTSSAALPQTTMRPAVTTIGSTSTVAWRTASSRGSPASRRRRTPARKKMA